MFIYYIQNAAKCIEKQKEEYWIHHRNWNHKVHWDTQYHKKVMVEMIKHKIGALVQHWMMNPVLHSFSVFLYFPDDSEEVRWYRSSAVRTVRTGCFLYVTLLLALLLLLWCSVKKTIVEHKHQDLCETLCCGAQHFSSCFFRTKDQFPNPIRVS